MSNDTFRGSEGKRHRTGAPIRFSRLLAALAVLALAAPAASNAHRAVSAGACSIPNGGEHLGPTYLTSLNVSGTSCSAGLAVVRGYHSCQLRHGGVKGYCTSSVNGLRCTERRGPSIATEFYSSVSCRAGSRRVNYKYTQFT
jgi:hypothetical protein